MSFMIVLFLAETIDKIKSIHITLLSMLQYKMGWEAVPGKSSCDRFLE